MLFPKTPTQNQLGGREIYKGYCQEGPGQYKIHKTKDWVEEDFKGMNERMYWATKNGFKWSAALAFIDIFAVRGIKERKAQIARFAYFTIPLTSMAASWMGALELSKIAFGRDDSKAWVTAAIAPGGIAGIWTRNIYGGMRTGLLLALIGYTYQECTNNNLTNSLFPNYDNPNIPFGYFEKNTAFYWPTRGGEGQRSTLFEDMGMYKKDPGPSWKKWEDAEKEEKKEE